MSAMLRMLELLSAVRDRMYNYDRALRWNRFEFEFEFPSGIMFGGYNGHNRLNTTTTRRVIVSYIHRHRFFLKWRFIV